MNYRFADPVRKVLAMARMEAYRRSADQVETAHILLALLESGGGSDALLEGRADRTEIRRLLEEGLPAAPERAPARRASRRLDKIPYTSGSKLILEYAMACAREAAAHTITTGHVLQALAKDKGLAGTVLRGVGITIEALRSVERGDGEGSGGGGGFVIRIDDTSSQSLFEQIVAQVREGIATGGLKPGERLPPVRTLADHLDIAPGTVARAYSELEARGLVVTRGARGTRVAEPKEGAPPADQRPELLVGLLRPVAVAGFHMGATAGEIRDALDEAMRDIFGDRDAPAA